MANQTLPKRANPDERSGIAHTFRALRHRNFRLFFIGQMVSWCGTWMQQIALAWLAYSLSNSAFILSLVTFAAQAPVFLLSPFTGALVDRFNRRKLVITTQSLAMVQALALAGLTFAHVVQIWHLIVLGVLLGIVNSIDMPGRQAFMVHMVEDKGDLPNAIALNSSLVNAARLIGPTIAGFLISMFGEATCFLLNGISYLAVITALILMHVPPTSLAERRKTAVFSHMKEGWRYALGWRPIRALIVVLAISNFFAAVYVILMPVFAKDIYHGGASALGFLMSASGVGALIGAVFLAARKQVPGLGKWILISTCVYGAALAVFAMAHNYYVGLGLLVFIGFGMMVQTAGVNTILQTVTDEDKRGRVMSLYTMAFMITPFGGVLAGAAASHIGITITLAICGIITLISGLWFGAQLKSLQQEARPIYIQKGVLQEDLQ